MASKGKDPAVLWYWNDWYGGTVTFSRHLKGCYMDLLHAQFNGGPLSLEEIKTVLGSDFGPAWPTLQKKFRQDLNGLFFNEKMEAERERRRQQSMHQSANAKKRWGKQNVCDGIDSAYAKEMPLETETEINKGVKGGLGELEENRLWTIEHCMGVALIDDRWVNANKTNKHELQEFNAYLESQGVYEKNIIDYKRHFSNRKRLIKPLKSNGTHQRNNAKPSSKSEGAERILDDLLRNPAVNDTGK